MNIIYGLGNPGQKYSLTKHNVGWIILETILQKSGLKWETCSGGFVAKTLSGTLLFKSAEFMNLSGQSFHRFTSYKKLNLREAQILVIQDDSDQFVGSAKLSLGGGSAGHRGIEDIYRHSLSLGLNIDGFWRLKVGIRPLDNRLKSETFVLKNIGPIEEKTLAELGELVFQDLQKNNLSNLINLQQIINSKYVFKSTKAPEKTE